MSYASLLNGKWSVRNRWLGMWGFISNFSWTGILELLVGCYNFDQMGSWGGLSLKY